MRTRRRGRGRGVSPGASSSPRPPLGLDHLAVDAEEPFDLLDRVAAFLLDAPQLQLRRGGIHRRGVGSDELAELLEVMALLDDEIEAVELADVGLRLSDESGFLVERLQELPGVERAAEDDELLDREGRLP